MPYNSPGNAIKILLAEDDQDDCYLFKLALDELPLSFELTVVPNGEILMEYFYLKKGKRPDVLFMDLNMPRKNGFQCLSEIRRNVYLKQLPVIVYSTSLQQDVVNLLYINGAQHYFRKPNDFHLLKKLIYQAVSTTLGTGFLQPAIEEFVLSE